MRLVAAAFHRVGFIMDLDTGLVEQRDVAAIIASCPLCALLEDCGEFPIDRAQFGVAPLRELRFYAAMPVGQAAVAMAYQIPWRRMLVSAAVGDEVQLFGLVEPITAHERMMCLRARLKG